MNFKRVFVNSFNVNFYSSSSYMNLGFSLMKGSLKITLAEAFDKNKKTIAKKGERRYDHINSVSFSLRIVEIIEIIRNMKNLISGKYRKRRRDKNGEEVVLDYMEFYHTRILNIKYTGNDLVSINIFDPEKNKTVYYVFNVKSNSFYMFMNILKSFVQIMPILSMFVRSLALTDVWFNVSDAEYNKDVNVSKPSLPYSDRNLNSEYNNINVLKEEDLSKKDIFDDNDDEPKKGKDEAEENDFDYDLDDYDNEW